MKKQLLFTTITLLTFTGFAQSSLSFLPNHNVVLCGSADVYFVCTSPSTPDNIWWDFGDGCKGIGVKPIHRYTTAGLYTVKMITEKAGIKDSVTKADFVTLHSKPKASFTVNLATYLKPYERILTFSGKVNDNDTVRYSWRINNSIILGTSKLTYYFGANGKYPVLLTVTNNRGCSDEFIDTVEINDSLDNNTGLPSIVQEVGLNIAMLSDQNIFVTRGSALQEATIKIIDITGKVMQQVKMEKEEISMQLQTTLMPPSTYIFEISSQGFTKAKRFLKQ
jgi:PKD repeat protein